MLEPPARRRPDAGLGIDTDLCYREHSGNLCDQAGQVGWNTASALRSQAVDGIIIVVPHEFTAEGLCDLPPELPIVVIGAQDGLPFSLAAVDQHAGTVRAARRLLGLGRERVWHLSGPPHWVDANGRIAGWREVLAATGARFRRCCRGTGRPGPVTGWAGSSSATPP